MPLTVTEARGYQWAAVMDLGEPYRVADLVWAFGWVEPEREFVWQTRRMWLTWAASHLLAMVGPQCRNTLRIDVTGPGNRLFWLVFGRFIRQALVTENAGFKAQAEAAIR